MQNRQVSNSGKVSADRRKNAIDLIVKDGKSLSQVAFDFKIPKSTLSGMVKRFRETETYEYGIRGGAKNVKITENTKAQLLKLIEDDCTITLQSMIEKLNLNVSQTTVWRWLKSFKISFKMTRQVPQSRNCAAVKQERREYANWYTNLPIGVRYEKLIFIDESPFSLHMLRAHGRSPIGTTPNPIVINSRGPNVTMILAVSALSVVYCEAVTVGVNCDIFQEFLNKVRDVLGGEDYIIVMDNVRFHHSNMEFYDEYPYEIKYLPRYSPFLNPCEEVFSQIKSKTRKDGPIRGSNDLIQRMTIASQSVTETYLKNYFQHSETFLGACHTLEDVPRN